MEGKSAAVAAHSVTIDDCKKFSATAIESVDSFSPSQIVLGYPGGRITVSGNGLKIVAFSKGSGAFSATGTVTGIWADRAAPSEAELPLTLIVML